MRILTIGAIIASLAAPMSAQRGNAPQQNDPIRTLVSQLELEKYKATIKGLTQFGDRRAGSDRNRAAIDWIEAQLKSYGCTNTERLKYEYPLQVREGTRAQAADASAASAREPASTTIPTRSRIFDSVNSTPGRRPMVRAKRSTARRSERRIPKRCTSCRRTWTASAMARLQTMTDPERRS